MAIREEDVRHVALLSRLELAEGDAATYARDLSGILGYIEKLQQLPTENVAPTSHPFAMENVLRADVVRPSLTPEEALANAPERVGDCFKVPQLL